MMIALKGRISIYNEGSFCLPSLSMLILSLSAILTKDVPDWECIAFVKSKDCVFACVHVLCQYKHFSRIVAQNEKNLRMFLENNIIITEK